MTSNDRDFRRENFEETCKSVAVEKFLILPDLVVPHGRLWPSQAKPHFAARQILMPFSPRNIVITGTILHQTVFLGRAENFSVSRFSLLPSDLSSIALMRRSPTVFTSQVCISSLSSRS